MNQEDIFNMKRCNSKDNCSEIGKKCCQLAIIGPTGPQGIAGGTNSVSAHLVIMQIS